MFQKVLIKNRFKGGFGSKKYYEGGYSRYYPVTEPTAPIVGHWKTRYCSLADTFKPILEKVFNFEVRADDVFIVTSTKCGTTWAQEMAWLIMNDLNFDKANEVDLTIRSPFLEFNGVVQNVPYDTIEKAHNEQSPRLLKSHLPAMFLPQQIWSKKAKIIYVFRNPKDAAISYYHHWRGMVGYNGSKESFMKSYMDGHVNFNPFWPHVLDFWQMRNKSNIFFTSYEYMKSDLSAVIKSICQFLNKTINADEIAQLTEHLSFDKMKNNSACNHINEFESMRAAACREVEEFRFIRRGIVGSHKDELPPNIIQEFDKWNYENLKEYNLSIDDFTQYSKYQNK